MPVRLHADISGPSDGPALVLSGSLGSTLAMWEPQMPALRERFRVIRLDHRGHGGSPAPDGPYTLPDLAGDVESVLDELGVATAHFCGLSLGGMIGMQLAADAPERVGRLVLCCTSAALDAASWRERAALVRAEGAQAVATAVVGRWFTEAYRDRNPEEVESLRATIAATAAEGYAGCCEAIAGMQLEGLLGGITAPTLVIAGADDPATPPDHAERIAAKIPEARVRVIDGAAHLANAEQPGAFTALLLGHLDADGLEAS